MSAIESARRLFVSLPSTRRPRGRELSQDVMMQLPRNIFLKVADAKAISPMVADLENCFDMLSQIVSPQDWSFDKALCFDQAGRAKSFEAQNSSCCSC